MIKKAERYELEIWTDGSCQGNPGPGGWAYLVKGTVSGKASGGALLTTNNQMELTAILRLLRKLVKAKASQRSKATIHTDSKYAMQSVTVWYKKWQTNGWKTSSGKPVQNAELISEILLLTTALEQQGWEITFNWVKGHADCEENILVDQLAVAQSNAVTSKQNQKV